MTIPAALILAAAPAVAQVSPAIQTASAPVNRTIPWLGSPVAPGITTRTVELEYRLRLTKLRNAMLKQQAKDGGQLSAENLARFQDRLDGINRTRADDLAIVSRRRI